MYVEPVRSTHNAPTLTWDTILRWADFLFFSQQPVWEAVNTFKGHLSLLSCVNEELRGELDPTETTESYWP